MSDFEQAFCAAASGDRVFVTRFTSTLGISGWDFLVRAYDARNSMATMMKKMICKLVAVYQFGSTTRPLFDRRSNEMNTRIKSMRLMAIATLAVVGFVVASVEAQTPASNLTGNSFSSRSEFRLDLFRFAARRSGVSVLPAGFSLMPARSASINASAMTPVATGPNLQVLGGGTLGRLTKWTGFTGSNSFIGDSTILESKSGLVGIGTDSPTSKLTVAGMIETTLGGFKFPDGTVQTTAGLASLFHDATFQGSGTVGSPLGVAVPLNLTGAIPSGPPSFPAVLNVTNTAESGNGVNVTGGNGTNDVGGTGVVARGGSTSGNARAGNGAFARGGDGVGGGDGLVAFAGTSNIALAAGASGVVALGGANDIGAGGFGVLAVGGTSRGAGNRGGSGILAAPGEGLDGASNGLAGDFRGDVEVSGNLSKGGGSFKIDHPLNPQNKYLYHSFVESPDMMNIYNGNVVTGGNGDATIELPAYFEALNRDFRYQLTVIGTFAQAIVADEIKDNRFTIKTSAANVKVSWQVTGIRQDPYANMNRIKVEEDKPERERGLYLHPEAFNQPGERRVWWVGVPEQMERLKQRQPKH